METQPCGGWLKAKVLDEPALVGRERELTELMRNLNLAIEGKGSTVFVTGEAGSGKTKLTREFMKAAREKRVAVLTGWCLSDAATPYFSFVEAFNSYFARFEEEPTGSHMLGETLGFTGGQVERVDMGITAWLAGPKPVERTSKPEMLSPQVWKDQVFAGVARTLHAISAQEPIILFIEDIHWADSASLALLHYVARATKNCERILVLATFRSEELMADAEGRPHPLAETLRMMDREDLYTEIRIPNLNQSEVSRIAENMIGGSLQSEFAEKLSAESGGNPLFVVESLRMLSERRSLYLEDDGWRLSVDALGIPSKLKNIILRRLSVLKFNQKRILNAASVIGDKFDVELLGAVLGQDTLEVLETLNTIAQSTSLVSVEGSYFRFDHTKSREAVYEEIPLPLRKGYHTRVAERLENTAKSGQLPFSDIAYHYAQAGNSEKAVKYTMAAGEDALARFSNAEAIKHFTYVMEKTSNSPENAETKRTALERLGDAYYANCMFAKALKLFEQLGNSEIGEVKLRAYRKAMDAVIFGDIGSVRLAELARKAELCASSNRLESARIRFLRAGFQGALEDFEEVLRVFEEEYSLPDVARVLVPFGKGLMNNHMYGKGVGAFLRSIALWEEIGDLHGLIDALYHSGYTLYFYGVFFQETWDMCVRTVQIGEKIGAYSIIGPARLVLGIMAESLDHHEEAISQLLKVFEISVFTDVQYTQNTRGLALLARPYIKLGDLKRAEEILKIASVPPKIYPSNELLNKRQDSWVIWGYALLFAA